MEPRARFVIKLVDKDGVDLRLGDVLIDIVFFQNRAFRYSFIAGRTNSAGELSVAFDEIEKQRAQKAKAFLMDYNTKIGDCDSTVELRIRTHSELEMAQQRARQSYGRDPDWVSNWPSNRQVKADPTPFDTNSEVPTAVIRCAQVR